MFTQARATTSTNREVVDNLCGARVVVADDECWRLVGVDSYDSPSCWHLKSLDRSLLLPFKALSEDLLSYAPSIWHRCAAATYGTRGYRRFDIMCQANPDKDLAQLYREFKENPVRQDTYFLREPNLAYAARALAPQVEQNPLQILTIGCASGKESYSFCSLLFQNGIHDFSLTSVDVNPALLRQAEQGVYRKAECDFHVGSLSPTHFTVAAEAIEATAALKEKIIFNQHDIIEAPVPGHFGIAVANNLLYHYPEATRKQIVKNVTASIIAGGFFTIETRQCRGAADRSYHDWCDRLPDLFPLERTEEFLHIFRKV